MRKAAIPALLFCVLVLFGCGKESEGGKDKVSEKDAKDKPAPEMILVAEEVIDDLDPENWNKKVDKYLGKRMVVEGVVSFANAHQGKIIHIVMVGKGGRGQIQCRFNTPPKQEPDQIKKGQKIKIRGECNGAGLLGLTLQECTIVELGEAPKKETPVIDKEKNPESKEPLPKKDVVSVKPEDLYKEYKADQKATEKKYENKILEMKGNVYGADSINFGSHPTVFLKALPDVTFTFECLCCQFPLESEKKILPLVRGQNVTIRGQFAGSSTDSTPLLKDCEFVEAGPCPGIKVSAVELTKDFAANAETASKKYNNKTLFVEGTVAEAKKEAASVKVYLAGFDETAAKPIRVAIFCPTNFDQRLEKVMEPVKKGAKITIKGVVSIIPGITKAPEISMGVLMPDDTK